MAAPVSLTNAAAQSLDTIYSAAGTPGLKMGLGSVVLAGITPPGEWQAAATHVDGTTFGTGSDGVSVAGVRNAAGNAVALESSAAGTSSPTILTVQGDASGVPLPVSLTLGTLSVEGLGTPGAQSGLLLTVQGDPAATPIPVTLPAVTAPIPVNASATGGHAVQAATLAAAVGKTTRCSGFQVTGAGATAASVVTVTLTGPAATQNYVIAVPAGATVGIAPLVVSFVPPLEASATNTAIVVSVPDFGAGNTAVAVAAQGDQI